MVKAKLVLSEMQDRTGKKVKSTPQVRATISFAPDVYETLGLIARDKKVSLAWVVREAVDNYLGEKWPLFKGQE